MIHFFLKKAMQTKWENSYFDSADVMIFSVRLRLCEFHIHLFAKTTSFPLAGETDTSKSCFISIWLFLYLFMHSLNFFFCWRRKKNHKNHSNERARDEKNFCCHLHKKSFFSLFYILLGFLSFHWLRTTEMAQKKEIFILFHYAFLKWKSFKNLKRSTRKMYNRMKKISPIVA